MVVDVLLALDALRDSGGSVNTGNTNGDTSIDVSLGVLDVGDTWVVTYDVLLTQAVRPNTAVSSTTTSLAYNSVDSTDTLDARAYSDTAAAVTIDVPEVTIGIALSATSISGTSDADLQVGETATFLVTVTFPESTVHNGVLSITHDDANGKLRLESASYSSGGENTPFDPAMTGITASLTDTLFSTDGVNDHASFTLAASQENEYDNVANADDTYVVAVVFEVVDDSENAASDSIDITATFVHDQDGDDITATTSVTLREPVLAISAFTVSPTEAEAGDTVTYEVSECLLPSV